MEGSEKGHPEGALPSGPLHPGPGPLIEYAAGLLPLPLFLALAARALPGLPRWFLAYNGVVFIMAAFLLIYGLIRHFPALQSAIRNPKSAIRRRPDYAPLFYIAGTGLSLSVPVHELSGSTGTGSYGLLDMLIVSAGGALVVVALALRARRWRRAVRAAGIMALGDGEYLKGDAEKAAGRYREALSVLPDSAAARLRLGWALEKAGKREDALGEFDTALAADTDSAGALWGKGVCLRRMNRLKESLECMDRATALRPGSVSVHISRGNTLSMLGRGKEAVEAFNRAIELDPENPAAWFDKGTLLIAIGMLNEAAGCFEKAAALAPDNGDAKRQMEFCRRLLDRASPPDARTAG